jgi:hypothetical protein
MSSLPYTTLHFTRTLFRSLHFSVSDNLRFTLAVCNGNRGLQQDCGYKPTKKKAVKAANVFRWESTNTLPACSDGFMNWKHFTLHWLLNLTLPLAWISSRYIVLNMIQNDTNRWYWRKWRNNICLYHVQELKPNVKQLRLYCVSVQSVTW